MATSGEVTLPPSFREWLPASSTRGSLRGRQAILAPFLTFSLVLEVASEWILGREHCS